MGFARRKLEVPRQLKKRIDGVCIRMGSFGQENRGISEQFISFDISPSLQLLFFFFLYTHTHAVYTAENGTQRKQM